ncbi:ankyrin repeat-containing protein [Penicillium malachiteum]|uniref:ankyrin repeat-containing protein n=1 Tax=Penicillium malachiteum TaxID=1324776 RepID=UPI002546595A|nr:ankyrin repeat-containing protein [Penicillium malachiteum]KAJ5731300.1 ankyrin repeat-containing protein [Penicillium malachiteum]
MGLDNNTSTVSNEDDRGKREEEEEKEDEGESCRFCDKTQVVKRKARDMTVHFGLIASGNQVIKDTALRRKLKQDLDGHVLCVEREAAGLMNNFPCIVIRGICNYADSHKNKDWQEYAAVRASAFAKELLSVVHASEVARDRPIKEILGHVLETVSQTSTNVNKMRTHLDNMQDLRILEWLTPIDFGAEQNNVLPDMPGAGKTIISSIVIDHLDQEFQAESTIGIAYVYCNFRRRNDQKINNLLASLLKQLARQCQSLPNSVKIVYEHHEPRATRPSVAEILLALQTVAATFSRLFIIVDALDECQTSSRLQFLSELFKLQSGCNANILATPQFIPDIMDQYKGSLWLEIRATVEDLREEVKSAISDAADGMFLLAQIYIASLEDKLTTNAIRRSLTNFKKQDRSSNEEQKTEILAHAYDPVMERIGKQQTGLKQLAVKVLSWITCATRPLRASELRYAVAIKHGESQFDEEDMPHIEDMVSVCMGLITMDDESSIVRLVHYTTQEYLRARKDWLLNAHTKIARSSVTCLSFGIFEIGCSLTAESLDERLRSTALYGYAAKN